MNQRRAKMIRKRVYGDMARKPVEYEVNTKSKEIRAKGLRRKYQKAKDNYMVNRRKG